MSGMFSNWPSHSRSSNLSVLGYSSKIFRDDEKAKELDEGKHLIPWMGDTSVKIDRFDVRAYLNDTTQFDVGQDNKVYVEDKEIEEQCQNERYKALIDIEGDEEIYEEEYQKRIKYSLNGTNKYSQVFYNYQEADTRVSSHSCSLQTVTDAPFKPDPELTIPPNIVLPTSSNLNKIIEKTAAFVLKHGKQMEIFIKARQSKNSKFNFMDFENDLHPYYKFLLNNMKTANANEDRKPAEISSAHQLSSKSTVIDGVELAPRVCSTYIVEHCPYNMLVDKIQNIQQVEDNYKP